MHNGATRRDKACLVYQWVHQINNKTVKQTHNAGQIIYNVNRKIDIAGLVSTIYYRIFNILSFSDHIQKSRQALSLRLWMEYEQ